MPRRHGDTLLQLLREAGESDAPRKPDWTRLEPAQDQLARKLMARLRVLAEQQQISAPLLATRKDIEALVLGRRDLPLLQGWRRDLAGETLLGMLGGG